MPADDNPCFHVTFSCAGIEDAPPPRPFPTSPVPHGPALLAARHRLHLQISVLPAASGDVLALSPSWTWPAPIRPSHLPSRTCPRCSQACQHTSSHPAHGPPSRRTPPAPALSSPAFLHSPTESAHAPATTTAPAHHSDFPTGIRASHATARPTAGAPEPSDPALICLGTRPALAAARPCPRLEALQCSRAVCVLPLELSADDADACVARLAGAPHLAALVTTLTQHAYPPAHGPSFVLAFALALRSMRALSALTLATFDTELLSAVPGTLTHLTLLADTLPYAFFDGFLAAPVRARLTHLALPHFAGVPPAAQDVPSAAVPRLAVLDSSPGLAAALAPGRPLRRVTLHIASTLYDGLRPAALFGALGGSLKELVLVLAPDVDVRTRGRLLGALGYMGAGLEGLELSLDGTSDEVSLQALCKQVGSLLPNVRALRTLCLRTSLPTEAAKAEEGPSRLALWTRPPRGSGLCCVVFPSGAHWELERGEWVRVK
ncbi:hypothetical protein EDB89DRAFT_2236142 [Lactarius sanguifluus]|nr:hypothetical protein EDB89DRAFT_2236142 [Lactarius sanguifluus]